MPNEFIVKNGLISQGNITISGSITATGGVTVSGSIASASYASNAELLDGLDSTVFTLTSSFNAQTASFTAFTSSMNSFSASILTNVTALNAKTASFATTGSNTFVGAEVISGSLAISGSGTPFTLNTDTLEITGSLLVTGSTTLTGSLLQLGNFTTTGTIIAQTINVQTVTSSIVYSSGSNVFGNSLGNSQTFTGSVLITGSLTIAGASSATSYNGATIFGSTIACSPIGCFATSCATSFIGGTMSGTTIYGSTAVCSPVGKFTSCIDAGIGTFSGQLTATTTNGGTSAIFLNSGVQNSNGIEIRGGTSATAVNWKLEKDNTLSNAFQITPSTTNGGTTFSTPAFTLTSAIACFSGTGCVNGLVSRADICVNGIITNSGTNLIRNVIETTGGTQEASLQFKSTAGSYYLGIYNTGCNFYFDNRTGYKTAFQINGTNRFVLDTDGIASFTCQVCAPNIVATNLTTTNSICLSGVGSLCFFGNGESKIQGPGTGAFIGLYNIGTIQFNSGGAYDVGSSAATARCIFSTKVSATHLLGTCLTLNGFSSGNGLKMDYGSASGQITAMNLIANGTTNGFIGIQMVDGSNGDLWLGGSAGRSMTLYRTGNIGFNVDAPCTRIHSEGGYGSRYGGNGCFYGGGISGGGMPYGDIYGNGASYTYQACFVTATASNLFGGYGAGYFKGGNGENYGGGGAGIVAIGGNGGNSEGVNAGGGAGIFARGGLNGAATALSYAGWFDGGDVMVRCGSVLSCAPKNGYNFRALGFSTGTIASGGSCLIFSNLDRGLYLISIASSVTSTFGYSAFLWVDSSNITVSSVIRQSCVAITTSGRYLCVVNQYTSEAASMTVTTLNLLNYIG